MCELTAWPWPRLFLKLPFALRLLICSAIFPLCLTTDLLHLAGSISSCFMTVPIAFCSWGFSRKGACICFFSWLAIRTIATILLLHTFLWPFTTWLSFLGDVTILFGEATMVVSLRRMLDHEEETRQKAEEGERQTRIAHAQQLQFNLRQRQFLINVNHELRTPLSALYSYIEFLQLLLEQHGQLDKQLHSTHFKSIMHYCAEMQTMVDNVLKTIEINNGSKPSNLDNITLIAVIYDIFNSIDVFCRAQRRVVHLDVPCELTVYADKYHLRHILHNLLSNAFKFAPADTPVTICASLNEERSEVCISVKDLGPGIPPDEMPLLFDPFTRLKRDLAGTVRGTGLGLSICKHLVEGMQGHIWAESAGIPGQGSCFSFTLPHRRYGENASNIQMAS